MFKPLPIVGGCYSDDSKAYSAQECINYLPVKSEVSGTRSDGKLSPVPGMVPFSGGAVHRVRGTYNAEGRFFAVIGTVLYQIATNGTRATLGTVPGTGRVSFAHNQVTGGNEVVVVNGTQGYVWNTKLATFAQITDADFPGTAVVRYLGQYLLGVKPDGTDWFTSDLATATTWLSTDTYEAESSPDLIRGLEVSQNRLLVLGTRTIEEWVNEPNESGTAAFQRATVIECGVASPHASVIVDNSMVFLDDKGIVRRLDGYTPVRKSNFTIEQAIAACDISQVFAFTWEDRGHKVVYFTFPDGHTFGWDVASEMWHRRQSYGLNRWRANTLTPWNGEWYAGDYANGILYRLDWDVMLEGSDALVRERIGPVISNNENRFTVDAIALTLDVGRPARHSIPELLLSDDFPDTCDDVAYSHALTISEGSGTYASASFVSGTYPSGTTLSIAGDQLTVAFSSATAGTYTFWIKVVDSDGLSSIPYECVIVVHDFQITGTLPGALTGVAYSEPLTLSDGVAPYGTPTLTAGALPTGGSMTVVGNTLVFAWPNTVVSGTYSFTARITDATGCIATSDAQVVVMSAAPVGAKYYFPLSTVVASGTSSEVIAGKDGVYSSGLSSNSAIRSGGSASMHLSANAQGMVADHLATFNIDSTHGWTIMCWCQPTSITGGGVLKNVATFWQSEQFGYCNWSFRLRGTNKMTPIFTIYDPSAGSTNLTASSELAVNDIAALAVTFTPTGGGIGTLRFYVNAALVATTAGASASSYSGRYLVCGSHAYPDSTGFIGNISDVVMWERTLSGAEITTSLTNLASLI